MKRLGLAVFALVCLVLCFGLVLSYAQTKEPVVYKSDRL